jgi:hypothetical protein
MSIVAAILHTIAIHYGYSRPDITVPEPYASLARKNYYIGLAILIGGTAMGRAAFIAYLLAILGSQKWQRIIFISLAVMELAVNLVSMVLIFATCRPPALLWDSTLTGTCMSTDVSTDYGYFQSSM